MDPGEQQELPPRAKWTDRMRRKERRMKLLYCLRIFSDEGWDTPWRQPQAINHKNLNERVVQTGWRMPMNTSQAKSFTRMRPPPTPSRHSQVSSPGRSTASKTLPVPDATHCGQLSGRIETDLWSNGANGSQEFPSQTDSDNICFAVFKVVGIPETLSTVTCT